MKILLLILLPFTAFSQWIEEYNFPGVLTHISFDSSGMLTSHQSGTIRLNGDTLLQVPTYNFNECGTLAAVYYLGELTYNSSSQTGQHIIKGQDTILSVPYTGTIHRGGCLITDNDTLYVSFGYGVSVGDAQDSSTLRGKIVRVFPPLFEPEIVCIGLRNPWKVWKQADSIWIADVGSDFYEEVNISYGGENFGWPYFEGDTTLYDTTGNFTFPKFSYPHAPDNSSITGGVFFRKHYYFCDLFETTGYRISDTVETFPYPIDIVAFGTDGLNLYCGSYDGRVYRLDQALSIDTIEVKPYVGPDYSKFTEEELIDIFGYLYVNIRGETYISLPLYTGWYYSIKDNKIVFIK